MARIPHDAAPEQKFQRKVLSVTDDGPLLHFHLDCSHLISLRKSDVAKPPPQFIDCWACRGETSQ